MYETNELHTYICKYICTYVCMYTNVHTRIQSTHVELSTNCEGRPSASQTVGQAMPGLTLGVLEG